MQKFLVNKFFIIISAFCLFGFFAVADVLAAPKDCLIRAGQACSEYTNLSREQKISLAKDIDAEAVTYQNFVWYLYQGHKYSWNLETNKIIVSVFNGIKKQLLTKDFMVLLAPSQDADSIGEEIYLWSGSLIPDAEGLISVSRGVSIDESIEHYLIIANTIIYTTKDATYRVRFPEASVDKLGNRSYYDTFIEDLKKIELNRNLTSFTDSNLTDCGSSINDSNKLALLCFAKKLRDCEGAKVVLSSKNFFTATARVAKNKTNGKCFAELSFNYSGYGQSGTAANAKKCLYDNSSLSKKTDAELIKSVSGFIDKFVFYNGQNNHNDNCIDNGQMSEIAKNWFTGPFNCERQGSKIDDYYHSGSAVYFSMTDSLDLSKDTCYGSKTNGSMAYDSEGTNLVKVSCDPSKPKDKSFGLVDVPCPFGCKNGACQKPVLSIKQKLETLKETYPFQVGYGQIQTNNENYFVAYYDQPAPYDRKVQEIFVYNLKTDKIDVLPLPASISSFEYIHNFNNKFYLTANLKVKEKEKPQVGIFELVLNSQTPFKLLKKFSASLPTHWEYNAVIGKDNLIFLGTSDQLYVYDLSKSALKSLYNFRTDKKLKQKDFSTETVLGLELHGNTLFFGPTFNAICTADEGVRYYLHPLSGTKIRPLSNNYSDVVVSNGIEGRVWLAEGDYESVVSVKAFDLNRALFGKEIKDSGSHSSIIGIDGVNDRLGLFQGKMLLAETEKVGTQIKIVDKNYLQAFRINKLYSWDGFANKQLIADEKILPRDIINYWYDGDKEALYMLSLKNAYSFNLKTKSLKTTALPFATSQEIFNDRNSDYLNISHVFNDSVIIRLNDSKKYPNNLSQCYELTDGNFKLLSDKSTGYEYDFDFSTCTWAGGGC